MDVHLREYALHLDQADPLKHFRERFVLRDDELIYLDGNSLGVLPKATIGQMENIVSQEWGQGLITSWNNGWYTRSREVAAQIASLIGAAPDEVIVTDSTSVNLFKLAFAALKYQQGRKAIVTDELNFPSDIYLLQGLAEQMGEGYNLRIAQSADGLGVSIGELERQLGNDTALLCLSHVLFKSAFMYDMKQVTALAHSKGAMVLWDLSHAAGSVVVELNEANVDLAVGCTYKYLNGGPGAPAFLYVRRDLQQKLVSPIWGWFGQQNPFAFSLDYSPAQGIDRFLAGTPPILSLSTLAPALEILQQAGMHSIRAKSISQGNYFISLFNNYLLDLGYQLGSPIEESQRGSHISLRHREAYRICKALINPGKGVLKIIPDFREPDNIRIGITPLYTRYEDLFIAVMRLRDIVTGSLYSSFSAERDNIT